MGIRLDECLEQRPTAEWYGLLGATHKELWQLYKDQVQSELAARHFSRSMDQYERGQTLEPGSYYCGINLVTMLYLSDDVQHARLHEAVSKTVVTLGRCSALRPDAVRHLNVPKAELYRRAASAFELAAVTGDWRMGLQAAECMNSVCEDDAGSSKWLETTICQVPYSQGIEQGILFSHVWLRVNRIVACMHVCMYACVLMVLRQVRLVLDKRSERAEPADPVYNGWCNFFGQV